MQQFPAANAWSLPADKPSYPSIEQQWNLTNRGAERPHLSQSFEACW